MVPLFRSARLLLVISMAVPALAGCGAHLYNAENDKTATQTKEKYAAADVTGVIKTARENSAQMTTATLEAFSRADLSLRDEKLWGLSLGIPSLNEVVREITERQLNILGGQRRDLETKGADLAGDVSDLAGHRSAITWDTQIIRIAYGFAPPSCEGFVTGDVDKLEADFIKRATPVKPATGPDPKRIIGDYRSRCQKLAERQASLFGRMAGPLGGGVVASWKREQKELARHHEEAAALKKKVDDAADAYKKAAAELAKDRESPNLQTKTKDAFEKLGTALNALADGADVIGNKVASEERLNQIQEAIKVVAGTEDAPKDGDKSLVALGALAGLPHLADEAVVIIKNRRPPLITPLLIEKERQTYLLTIAQQAEARMERRIALWQQLTYAMIDEALANDRILTNLCAALSSLDEAAACDPASKKLITLSDALDKADKIAQAEDKRDTKGRLWSALADYGHTYNAERPGQRQLQVQLAAISYEGALDESETALKLWEALITSPIDQLVAYHATGIKPEDVANLIVQAVGLGSIGAGVNK